MAHTPSSQNAGFTLIELSVVLLILAIITAGILSIINRKGDAQNINFTNERLNLIEQAIGRYVALNEHLPCPAPMDAPENTASFGFATDCTATPVTDETWETGTGTETIRFGALPTRTLGLSDKMMIDAWKGRIGYAVIKDLAIDDTNFDSYTTSATDGVITIHDEHGNQMTSSSASGIVSYAIISFGKDRNGTYTRAGALSDGCAAGRKQTENCDFTSSFNNIFVDADINDSDVAANYYYDFIRWKTYQRVKAYQQ